MLLFLIRIPKVIVKIVDVGLVDSTILPDPTQPDGCTFSSRSSFANFLIEICKKNS